MTRGVVFYSDGGGVHHLMPVALSSLKAVYDGDVSIVLGVSTPNKAELAKSLEGEGVRVVMETENVYTKFNRRDFWGKKAWHHIGQYPYDVNLYFDLDHVFNKFDKAIFDKIADEGMVVSSDGVSPNRGRARLRELNKFAGTNLKGPYIYVNGGMMGAVKGFKAVREGLRIMDALYHGNCTWIDEHAWSGILMMGLCGRVGSEWSRMPKCNLERFKGTEPMAWHFVSKTYGWSRLWWDTFTKARNKDFLCCGSNPGLFNISAHWINQFENRLKLMKNAIIG